MALPSISDRMSGGVSGKAPKHSIGAAVHEPERAESGGHTQLHDHGDGSFHSVTSDGQKTEHPHIGHAMAHIAAHHEPEGSHTHVHHTEEGHTAHHAKDGQVTGPNEHEDLESVRQGMEEATGGGEHEPSGYESHHSGKEHHGKELFG